MDDAAQINFAIRVFILVTGVRLPVGSPQKIIQ